MLNRSFLFAAADCIDPAHDPQLYCGYVPCGVSLWLLGCSTLTAFTASTVGSLPTQPFPSQPWRREFSPGMKKEDLYARMMHTPDDPARAELRAALREAWKQLMPLHRALIDDASAEYSATIGPVSGPTHLLRLLQDDPFFEWLRHPRAGKAHKPPQAVVVTEIPPTE